MRLKSDIYIDNNDSSKFYYFGYYSIYYNDLLRKFFFLLIFVGMLLVGIIGIPMLPQFFISEKVDYLSLILTLYFSLVCIWALMAYREFTRSNEKIFAAHNIAKKLHPLIGDYSYQSYNPDTRKFESGFIPLGPLDFWDTENIVPSWLDKGKYWHVLLGFQDLDKDIVLQILDDKSLTFSDKKNVAFIKRESINNFKSRNYRYRICIPQWLVMNTDINDFLNSSDKLNMTRSEIVNTINYLNKLLADAADEIIEREKLFLKYPWPFNFFFIYINKSLPIKLVYDELYQKFVRYFPAARYSLLDNVNRNLAYIKNTDLIDSIVDIATIRNIPSANIEKIKILTNFLKNEYEKYGLGEGSHHFHNLHHSLEVAYISMYMLPHEINNHQFGWEDYELILVAGLLHDYDPLQHLYNRNTLEKVQYGPKVERTIEVIKRQKILQAHFNLDPWDYQNYLKTLNFNGLEKINPVDVYDNSLNLSDSMKSIITEALIWRTDFPFYKKEHSVLQFQSLLDRLGKNVIETDKAKYELLGEVLSLSDLSVTYMGADPIRAWDRVITLYEEFDLPKSIAISGTYEYFSEFVNNDLFNKLISRRSFPDIFKQRWNLVYQFYHEGNSANQLNRVIHNAQRVFQNINLEITMHNGEILLYLANKFPTDYFIGISNNSDEVFNTKKKFSESNFKNVFSVFGNIEKVLPNIKTKSIDNILLSISEINLTSFEILNIEFIIRTIKEILKIGGTLQILSQLEDDNEFVRKLFLILDNNGFKESSHTAKNHYFFDVNLKKDGITKYSTFIFLNKS